MAYLEAAVLEGRPKGVLAESSLSSPVDGVCGVLGGPAHLGLKYGTIPNHTYLDHLGVQGTCN